MTGLSLEKSIAECEVRHPRFNEIFNTVSARIAAALRGGSPKVTWVIGPSRIGKTQLTKAIAQAYPPSVKDGSRHVPVIIADAPGSTTILLLPMRVLEALQVPFRMSNTSAGKLTEDMLTQLDLAGTKSIVFDEASQMVEPGARVEPFAASEWFKQTENRAGVSQILLGVPRLERLISANNQLRMRSYKKIVWHPYDASVEADRDNYMASVNAFLDIFRHAGWTFAPSLEVITANCYLHAPGLIGALSDLLKEFAKQRHEQQPRELTLQDFRAAASVIEGAGHPDHPAFEKEQVSLVELNKAYTHVRTSNDMA